MNLTMDDAIKKIENFLQEQYGAKLISNDEGIQYIDEHEKLLCCFSFPNTKLREYVIGKKGKIHSLFPDMKMMFIYDIENCEVFNRICQGEARGIPWETIEMLCKILEDAL